MAEQRVEAPVKASYTILQIRQLECTGFDAQAFKLIEIPPFLMPGVGVHRSSRARITGYVPLSVSSTSNSLSLVNNTGKTFSGNIIIDSGELRIVGDPNLIFVSLTINSGSTLIFNGTSLGSGASDSRITLTTAITQTCGSAITLSGTNAYSEATALNAGKLFINGNQTSATANIIGSTPATVNLPSGWAATLSISGNHLPLNVTSTGQNPYQA